MSIVAVPGSGGRSECAVLPNAHSSDQGISEANLQLLIRASAHSCSANLDLIARVTKN